MHRRRYRRWGPPARVAPRWEGRLRTLTLAATPVLVVAIVAAVVAVGWRLWFAPSNEATPIEACADPRCQVSVAVAVDGTPLVEPLSFVLRADSAVEIDFVFQGLPVAPEEVRLLTPEDQRWLVAEGTLDHPETWPSPKEDNLAWASGWDRAGNGAGTLRRWWRPEPDAPWIYVLPAARALQAPSGAYAVGSDALVTVTADTRPGNYLLTIEAVGPAVERPVIARAQLVVSVLAGNRPLAPTPASGPSGRWLLLQPMRRLPR